MKSTDPVREACDGAIDRVALADPAEMDADARRETNAVRRGGVDVTAR